MPNHPVCEGLDAQRIDEGWFGDIRLDGLIIGSRFHWPGPIHNGGGRAQGFISAQADQAQRAALLKILDGQEQAPSTVFNIYGSTIEDEIEPLFADIEFACDLAARTGFFAIPGLLSMQLEPIKNPATGIAHYAQIVLPSGFEFRKAEVASASFSASGEIAFDNTEVYGCLTEVAYGPDGIIEHLSYGGS